MAAPSCPENQASLIERLLDIFSPPLDSALITAIANDFSDGADREADARAVLEPLAAEALIAEKEEDEAHAEEVERAFEAWSLQEDEGVSSPPSTTNGASLDSESTTATSSTGEGSASDSALDFLRSIFPQRSVASLRHALQSLPPSDTPDVSSLVESILTEEYLASPATLASLQISAPNSPSLANAEIPSTSTMPRRKARGKRDQVGKRGKQTISLTDVMQSDLKRRHATAASVGYVSEDETSAPLSPFLRGGNEVDNRWVALDSQASYVGQLLDVTPGAVTSAYHRADSNLVLALDRLMLKLISERAPKGTTATEAVPEAQAEEAVAHEVSVQELQASPPVGPPRSPEELMQLSYLTRADAKAARKLVEFLDNLGRTHGNVSWNALTQHGSLDHLSHRASRRVVNSTSPSTSAPTSDTEDTAPLSVAVDNCSPAEHLSRASAYRLKRDSAYRSAAQAFQSARSQGGLQGSGKRGEAAYWAEEGRRWDAKVRSEEMKAARARVEERKRMRAEEFGGGWAYAGPAKSALSGGTVDLHGLTVNQALTITKEQVNAWWASETRPPPLLIVTGAGRHSHHANPILLPAVAKLLDREGWLWKYDTAGAEGLRGAILVKGVARR